MRQLEEFAAIVDGEWEETPPGAKAPTGEELTRALQVMLTRQVLYASTPGLGGTYELVRTHSGFFERYFAALGYRLVVSQRDQMVALSVPQGEARFDAVYERLRKDETIVLLALRLVWEEALGEQSLGEGGVCEITTDDLIDRIRSAAGQTPPEEARLIEILKRYQRHGAVRIGERDRVERITPVTVLPGVTVIVPDTFVDDLKLRAASATAESPANQNDGP